MVTHGSGALSSLIKSRSHTSLSAMTRRPSSFRGREREASDEEEAARPGRRGSFDELDDYRSNEERRMSAVLYGPQMRSQRLIGNSNPRYRWERYWKTEEELKPMNKPMYVLGFRMW